MEKARIIPSHERVGIEVFIALVGRGDAFWFFDDFSKKARMNASLIGRILREDLPIARSAGHSISSMNQGCGWTPDPWPISSGDAQNNAEPRPWV